MIKTDEILLSEKTIQRQVAELALQISEDFEDIIAIVVLKGAFIFASDLLQQINISIKIDFLSVGSYGASTTPGVVRLDNDIRLDISGRHVIIIEDIVDTGQTIQYLLTLLGLRHPASLSVCSLLSKPDRREIPINIDYLGFEIPNKFVVGYGLDLDEQFRNLSHIAVVEEK